MDSTNVNSEAAFDTSTDSLDKPAHNMTDQHASTHEFKASCPAVPSDQVPMASTPAVEALKQVLELQDTGLAPRLLAQKCWFVW